MKVEKLSSGNYRVRVIIGHTPDGTPIRKSFTHHDKTRLYSIVYAYADAHRNIINMTLGDAIDAFIAVKTAVLSPSTIRAYTSMAVALKTDSDRLCGLYLADINRMDVQQLVNRLVLTGHSPKTVRNYYGFLSGVFKFHGESLPEVSLPQKTRPAIYIPDEQQIKALALTAKGTRMEVPLTLAAFGLRRSEICALTVKDLNGSVLHICRATVYGYDNRMHTKAPKTYTSDRFVRIPDATADLIREQDYVTKYTPAGLSNAFYRLCEKAGVPHYRLHDLRHFFVSYCHNVLNMPDAQIQAITGHKTSVIMRENYLHVMHADSAGKYVSDSLSSML